MFKNTGLEVGLLSRCGYRCQFRRQLTSVSHDRQSYSGRQAKKLLDRSEITEFAESKSRSSLELETEADVLRWRRSVLRRSEITGLGPLELETQLELDNAADVLRRVFLGPDAVFRSRSINQRMYKFQFKTPERLRDYGGHRYMNPAIDLEAKSEDSGPKYYRLRNLPDTVSMDLVRAQFRSCLAPEDFTLVFSAIMRHNNGPEILANPSLQLFLQKWLVARLEPTRVLEFLSLFITRLESAGQKCEIGIIWSALIAAAQSCNTAALRRYLKMWCDYGGASNRFMEQDSFLELLVALRYGMNPLSAWERQNREAILEIMFGFSDPAFRDRLGAHYHLLAHMPSELQDWPILRQWIRILVDLDAGERVWEAWLLIRKRTATLWWKSPSIQQQWIYYPPRVFILALFKTSQPERAWLVFRKGGRGIKPHDDEVWRLLFEHAEFKCELKKADLQEAVQEKFTKLLSEKLTDLEEGLGLEWVPSAEEGLEGYHKFVDKRINIDLGEDIGAGFIPGTGVAPVSPGLQRAIVPGIPGKIFHNPGKGLAKSQRKALARLTHIQAVSGTNNTEMEQT